ncbi:MAG: class I SAM-dependent methyltransferase [Xenococcaceae cyanobacterium]
MNNSKLDQSWYCQNLAQKKTWYSSVAEAYNTTRPKYPHEIIDRVVELAQLTPISRILEIGCGPGTATVSFAAKGFSMVCLEPSLDSSQLAIKNCSEYSNVEIINTTFEEWELETEKFDAVLAATSIHWVSPEVAYVKVANALRDRGFLILLWNIVPAQPPYEIFQTVQHLYQRYLPSFAEYESSEAREAILTGLVTRAIDSGKFKDLTTDRQMCELTYNTEDYLTLLSTLSPYIAIDRQSRDALFAGLANKIETDFGGIVRLTYVSAFHVARK